MRWIVLLSVMVFATACSNSNEGESLFSSVKFNIEAGEMPGGGIVNNVKRGQAPVFIKSVVVSAHSLENGGKDVSNEFIFKSDNPNDGNDLVLENISIGRNQINAVGICKNVPHNSYHYVHPNHTDEDLDTRAEKYAEWLRSQHSIYASYTAEVQKEVVIRTSNNADINLKMITNNHRVAVVMDNQSEVYEIVWKLKKKNGSDFYNSGFMTKNTRWAYVVNDANAVGSITYVLTLEYYYKDTHAQVLDENGEHKKVTRDIIANAYSNITRYYKFENNTLQEGNANIVLQWVPLNVDTGGEEIF